MRTPAPDAAAIYDAMFCRMLTLLSPMTDRKRAWIQASIAAHMATGTRGLHKLAAAVQQKGYACVCLSWYWSKHMVKCEIALGKGKKEYDKRDTERERDAGRELQRAVRNKGKED